MVIIYVLMVSLSMVRLRLYFACNGLFLRIIVNHMNPFLANVKLKPNRIQIEVGEAEQA